MAAFITHLAIGLVLGLALRVHWRYLPVMVAAAGFVDLDNLYFYLDKPDPAWLTRRGTLQNLWFSVVFPTIAAVAVYLWPRASASAKHLFAAIPAATATHTLYDMILPHPPYLWHTGHMLLYPFSDTRWTFDVAAWMGDTRLFDGFSLLLLCVVPLLGASWLLISGLGREEDAMQKWVRLGAFAAVMLLVLPVVLFGFGVAQPGA